MRVLNPVNQVPPFVILCLLCSAGPAAAQQSNDPEDFSGHYDLTCLDAAYELALHVYSTGADSTREEGNITVPIPIPCGDEAESTHEVEEGLTELDARCLALGLPDATCASIVGNIGDGLDRLGHVVPTSVTATVQNDDTFPNRVWGVYRADVEFQRPHMDDLSTVIFISNLDGPENGSFVNGLPPIPLPVPPIPLCIPYVSARAEGRIDRDADFALEGNFRAQLSSLCPMGIHGDPERAYFGNLSIALVIEATGERCDEPACMPPVVDEAEGEDEGRQPTTPAVPSAPEAPPIP